MDHPPLMTLRQLVELYPAIKLRTLRYWVQQAVPRSISQGGSRSIRPGNGLESAIVRKGRIVLIDERLFLLWLYNRTERP